MQFKQKEQALQVLHFKGPSGRHGKHPGHVKNNEANQNHYLRTIHSVLVPFALSWTFFLIGKNEAGASKGKFIFHVSWPYCHTFTSLFFNLTHGSVKGVYSHFLHVHVWVLSKMIYHWQSWSAINMLMDSSLGKMFKVINNCADFFLTMDIAWLSRWFEYSS